MLSIKESSLAPSPWCYGVIADQCVVGIVKIPHMVKINPLGVENTPKISIMDENGLLEEWAVASAKLKALKVEDTTKESSAIFPLGKEEAIPDQIRFVLTAVRTAVAPRL